MNWKKMIAVGLFIFQIPLLTACMTTVTRYKTETVPVEVTKYRTVQKPVEKAIEVPYQEEVRTPQYRTIRNPKLNPPEGQTMTLAFLPFTSSTRNPDDGPEVSELLRQAVQRHAESNEKYNIVSSYQVRNTLAGELKKITPDDIRKLNSSLGVDTIITGHVKSRGESDLSFRVEGIAARTMRLLFGETVVGDGLKAIQQALDVFYGKKAQQGFKTEIVSKTRTETQTVYESVQEAYQETEYQEKKVSYDSTEVDWNKTFGWALIIGLVLLFTPAK